MTALDDYSQQMTSATGRAQQALARLQQALQAQREQHDTDTARQHEMALQIETLKAEVEDLRSANLKLKAENDTLTKQAAQAEDDRAALESKNRDAAGRIDDVIGQLRNVLTV